MAAFGSSAAGVAGVLGLGRGLGRDFLYRKVIIEREVVHRSWGSGFVRLFRFRPRGRLHRLVNRSGRLFRFSPLNRVDRFGERLDLGVRRDFVPGGGIFDDRLDVDVGEVDVDRCLWLGRSGRLVTRPGFRARCGRLSLFGRLGRFGRLSGLAKPTHLFLQSLKLRLYAADSFQKTGNLFFVDVSHKNAIFVRQAQGRKPHRRPVASESN